MHVFKSLYILGSLSLANACKSSAALCGSLKVPTGLSTSSIDNDPVNPTCNKLYQRLQSTSNGFLVFIDNAALCARLFQDTDDNRERMLTLFFIHASTKCS